MLNFSLHDVGMVTTFILLFLFGMEAIDIAYFWIFAPTIIAFAIELISVLVVVMKDKKSEKIL